MQTAIVVWLGAVAAMVTKGSWPRPSVRPCALDCVAGLRAGRPLTRATAALLVLRLCSAVLEARSVSLLIMAPNFEASKFSERRSFIEILTRGIIRRCFLPPIRRSAFRFIVLPRPSSSLRFADMTYEG
jgi:hypothetical protein